MSLTLHFHPLSSFCHKVLIALYENGTPFTPQIVDLMDEGERTAFRKLWPIGKFPVLRDDARGETVPESSIIIEYLDQHYPGRTRFIPPDAEDARQMRLRDRFFDLYIHLPMQKIVGDRLRPADRKDPHGVEEARAQIATALGMIEQRHAAAALGDRRGIHARRLRRRAGAVLCRQGDAVRRDAPECRRLSGAAEAAPVLCARARRKRSPISSSFRSNSSRDPGGAQSRIAEGLPFRATKEM